MMKLLALSLASLRVTRAACLLTLFGALQAPVHAQLPEPRPGLNAVQSLLPDESEARPSPGVLVSTLFGAAITRQGNTALIQELGYPDGNQNIGRIAVFIRNQSGLWVRNGSIDPPSGQFHFGNHMALLNGLALIESSEGATALLYRRSQGRWNLVQRLTPQSGYRFTNLALTNGWAFIGAVSASVGAVYVYQITSTGTLKGVQTLRSYSGNPADVFGARVAVSGGRVVVGAAGDSNGRGAAYVFELSGALFVKRQKLIAINGEANESFGHAVGISQDWIAIGAPGVEGAADNNCQGGGSSGAMYTFRRIGGVWLQQEALLADGARDRSEDCIYSLGQDLVISDKWIVGAVTLPFSARSDIIEPLVYVRDAGHYAPSAWASVIVSPQVTIHLADSTLFVGAPVEDGCNFEVCFGSVDIFDLNDAVP